MHNITVSTSAVRRNKVHNDWSSSDARPPLVLEDASGTELGKYWGLQILDANGYAVAEIRCTTDGEPISGSGAVIALFTYYEPVELVE